MKLIVVSDLASLARLNLVMIEVLRWIICVTFAACRLPLAACRLPLA